MHNQFFFTGEISLKNTKKYHKKKKNNNNILFIYK